MMARADGAGAHGKTAGFDTGAAEADGVGGGEPGGKLGVGESGENISRGELFCGEPSGSEGGSGANEKFAAVHGDLLFAARLL